MLSITVRGVQQEQMRLKNAITPDKIKKTLIKHGFAMEARAKQICTAMKAVDTGRLRASISVNWDGNSGRGKVEAPAQQDDGVSAPPRKGTATIRIGSNVEYAEYVHYGTARMRARPFIDVAIKQGLPLLIEDLKKLGEINE